MIEDLEYNTRKPGPALFHFVESFWMLANHSETQKDIVVLPDGRVDMFFSYSANDPYHVTLMGLEMKPDQTSIPPKTMIFAISFKLLAIEYLLDIKISSLLNEVSILPDDFWGITIDDLNDFENFCNKVSKKLMELKKKDIDDRKQKMFDLIYSSNGSLTVKEISEKVHWSSRQINRYFNEQFGISLKAYCTILRFRASFENIKEGKLFPEKDFTDQAHFIKEIKKFSGVVPKELFKNKNDRFVQFSTLKKK
jgi:AraC-like DNA-binding protein